MKKSFLKTMILASMCLVVFLVAGCTQNTTPPSKEQLAFEEMCLTIDELETLSEQYNSKDYTNRAFVYIRSEKYNTQEWALIGGDTDSNFDTYVQGNQEKDVSGLKTKESFVIPSTKESVDFVHMFAVINVNFIDSEHYNSDLSGWGGDLFQLASSIKDCGKTGSELKQYIQSLFNSENGAFNSQDVCADLDAVNISKLLKINNKTIAKTLSDYYTDLSEKDRKNAFILNTFDNNYTNIETLKQDIINRATTNNLLKFWGIRNNFPINNEQNLDILKECCNVFAEYLYN